jgi:predicted permease
MERIRQFVARIATLLSGDRAECELTREIASHLQHLEDRFLAQGMSLDEARLAARRAFGGVDQAKERQRDARSFRWIDEVWRDAGYAFRSLSRTPGFTIAAVLTLSVGIGATTAIYSVVDTVLLRPLPFTDADRLVRIVENERPRTMQVTNYQEFLEWRSRTTTLSGLAASTFNPQVMMSTRDGTVRLAGGMVSSNYFDLLGTRAMLGRVLQPSDDANPDVVVLTYDTWQRFFHGNSAALGSVIEFPSGNLAGRLFTVVGVLPQDLVTPSGDMDFYVPAFIPAGGRPSGLVVVFGRLKDHVTIEAASQEANTIGNAVRPPRPADAPPLTMPRFTAEGLKDREVAPLRPALRVFLIAVAVMLLIVCANVANLMLARGTARQREIAVRLAIGASRGRIVRQILTECVVLASAGGLLGAALGAAGVSLVKSMATVDAPGVFRLVFSTTILPRANEVGVNLRVLGTALGIAAITSIVFGVLPALQLSRTSHLQAMGTRGVATTRRDARVRTALVIGQLVMATVLLIGAGLLANSFIKLATVQKGYNPSNVLVFQLVFPTEYSTARKAETIETLLGWLRAKPNVQSAGFAYAGILLGIENTVGAFVPPGRALEEVQKESDRPRLKSLSRGYLEAAGAQLLAGRLLDERDSTSVPPTVVINRKVARRYFGDASPVGSYLTWHGGKGPAVQVQVIGVVDDVRQTSVEREAYPEIFMDYRQVLAAQQRWGASTQSQEALAFGFLSFAMRTRGDPALAIPTVREAVNSLDPNVGLDAIVPLERLVANSMARQRFYAVMLGVFAAVAGLLAAIGIYGVLAYAVVQRTQEIGVRVALGAERRQVLGLVLSRGLMLTIVGVAIGLVGAAAGARLLQGMLFGIQPLDVQTFVAVAIVFTMVALAASYLPARRATKVDPMVALRVD